MQKHLAGLWRHPDFLLWAGETISLFVLGYSPGDAARGCHDA
jgi:hypothetical protein